MMFRGFMIFFRKSKAPPTKMEMTCDLLLPAIRGREARLYEKFKVKSPDNLEILVKPIASESKLKFTCLMQVNGHAVTVEVPWMTNELKILDRSTLNTFIPSLEKFEQRCGEIFKALKGK